MRRVPTPCETGAMKSNRPTLTLSLQFADKSDRALLPRHKVTRWLRAALDRPAEITVRFVDVQEGRNLNHDYRGKDHATNVLTFDYTQQPSVVADLVLCSPVVRREAAEREIDLQAHYAHLLIHGALHAQGHDHQHDAAARDMESRERQVLSGLGFVDPYRG
jgi:probable rRNA maturation factor